MKTNYDVDYFLQFLGGIPDDDWAVGDFSVRDDQNTAHVRYCAAGHCGARRGMPSFPKKADALYDLMGKLPGSETEWALPAINDGKHPDFKQPTPKARILAALRQIKDKQT